MRILLDQYSMLEGHINVAEKRLASLLDSELSRRLRTIPGVGPAIAATLLAEIGDIRRFSDVDQLLAYAGVHPKEQSSGKKGANPETSWTMAAHFAESDHPFRTIPITQSGVFVTPLVGAVGTTASRVSVDPSFSPPRR